LGDVLRRVERFEPRDESTEYPFAGTYSFARGIFVGERKLGLTFALPKIQRIRAGDFIYCKIMAWEGAFGIAPKEADNCGMSGAFVVYELNRERIDEKFLDFFFKVPDHWQSIGGQSSGTNVRRQSLHPNQFERAEIPLPPLAEQRRVVARIEELAAQIHDARSLRHQACEEVEALIAAEMHQVFQFDEEQTSVGDFAKVQGGFAFASGSYNENGSHQVVRIGNVRDGFLDLSRAPVRWNPSGDARVLRYELKPGDLVISMTGTREKRDYGFIAKVPQDSQLLLNQRVGRFVVHREIEPDYLFHFLRSPFFRDRLFPSATGTANQANIGNGDIEGVRFAPPPLPEQRRIVAELDALQAEVDALKRLQAETAAELDALLPSILDKAFKGEL
jgi:type I restriction enzyme, S subunit